MKRSTTLWETTCGVPLWHPWHQPQRLSECVGKQRVQVYYELLHVPMFLPKSLDFFFIYMLD